MPRIFLFVSVECILEFYKFVVMTLWKVSDARTLEKEYLYANNQKVENACCAHFPSNAISLSAFFLLHPIFCFVMLSFNSALRLHNGYARSSTEKKEMQSMHFSCSRSIISEWQTIVQYSRLNSKLKFWKYILNYYIHM